MGKLGVAVLFLGLVIMIPIGIDDAIINVPLGLGIARVTNTHPLVGIASTYLLIGLPLVILGLFMVTKRQRQHVMNRFDL